MPEQKKLYTMGNALADIITVCVAVSVVASTVAYVQWLFA